jgi:hypothetical protein
LSVKTQYPARQIAAFTVEPSPPVPHVNYAEAQENMLPIVKAFAVNAIVLAKPMTGRGLNDEHEQ